MTTDLSWTAWIGGLLIALLGGAFANFTFGMAAFMSGHQVAAVLLLLIPGTVIALIGWRARWREGFGQGMIVGGCIIALAGGICGFTLGIGVG